MILGVPTFRRYDLLPLLLRSVERGKVKPDRYVIVDNGCRPDDVDVARDFADISEDRFEIVSPGRNVGVAGAWNLVIERAGAGPVTISNDDIVVSEDTLASIVAAGEDADIVRAPGFALFMLQPRAYETVGLFDENCWPAYCLTPEARVLTDELEWKPLGDLSVGDGLVGVEEEQRQRYGARRYVHARITALTRRRARVVRVVMVDGRETFCTENHRWLTKAPARGERYLWRSARQLRPGFRIYAPLGTWRTETSRDAGWLAGIFDGEGCIRWAGRTNVGITFAQKPGPVLDHGLHVLRSLGIPFTWRVGKQGVANVEINSKRHALQLLGSVRPLRLLQRRVWENKFIRARGSPQVPPIEYKLGIEHMEPAGVRDIVSIETTSRTYLAEGMVAHNCEDNDYTWRARLAGMRFADPEVSIHHEGSATLKCLSAAGQRRFGQRFEEILAYYSRKWGGRPGQEKFTEPFNGDAPANWTLRPDNRGEEPWLDL